MQSIHYWRKMALNVSYPLVFLTIFLLFFAISASITEGNSTSLPRGLLGSRPSAGHCFKGPRKSKACDDRCKQLNYYGGMIIKRRRRVRCCCYPSYHLGDRCLT